MHVITDSDTSLTLRRTTAEQLLELGGRHVVYLKAGMLGDEQVFFANGALLRVFDTIEEAVETVNANDLSFAVVH